MNENYEKLSRPPEWALEPIDFGKLSGKTAIDPQWRIDAMTEVYGTCGIGWKFEVDPPIIHEAPDEVMLYLVVKLYIRDPETKEWSAPIIGAGGDRIVIKDKKGRWGNQEAYKMCLTDALGNAMKYIGVAASIYRKEFDGNRYVHAPKCPFEEEPSKPEKETDAAKEALMSKVTQEGMDENFLAYWAFGATKFEDLSEKDCRYCLEKWDVMKPKYMEAYEQELSKIHENE